MWELRGLQDDVRPFPFAEVEETVAAELGLTLERAFLHFEEQPLAAASIGQVHRAVLPTGAEVAVKVQRPRAARQIEADIELLYQAARFARQRVDALRFIDTVAIVDEFARSIRQELDYRLEARNAERFRRNFEANADVHVPRVYWSYSAARILTLEYLDGTKVADVDVTARGAEGRRALVNRIAEAWMTMIFRHGFFHGDPHPANILELADGSLGLVDFGQAGKLSRDDMEKVTRLFIDAARENIDALPRRLGDLGVRYDRSREDEFVSELRDLYDRYYGARLSEIDPITLIREALSLIYRLNLRLPARFVLLDKALATLGSVGTTLYPEFNVFEVAKPYARGLLVDRFMPNRVVSRARADTRALTSVLAAMPYQISDVLEEFRDGEVEIGFRHEGIDELARNLDRITNRVAIALVGAGGVVGSAILGALGSSGWSQALAITGFTLSFLLGAWLAWGVARSGRL